MFASNGYCEIWTTPDGTVTAPYVAHPAMTESGSVTSPQLPEVQGLAGCLHEGEWDIDGNRACQAHLVTMIDLMTMRYGHMDVRPIESRFSTKTLRDFAYRSNA